MRFLLTGVLAIAALAPGQSTRTFMGTITDSMCADANHGRMRMGPTDPECVQACVESHDAPYVLYDGATTYELSDQKAPAKFAAQKVTVTGTLDAKTKTIQVQSIAAAP